MTRAMIIGFISVVILGTFLYGGIKGKDKGNVVLPSQTSFSAETQARESYESQKKSMGEVDVEVTPIKLESGQPIQFSLSFNTHSVDLSYDYTKIISAQDDKGNKYKATSWSGGNSGHHLEGELKLEELQEGASEVFLFLDGIDNEKGEFLWEL